MRLAPALALALAVVVGVLPSPTVAALTAAAPAHADPSSPVATDAVAVPLGSSVAALPLATPLRLAFTLPYANASRLSELLTELSNPSSPDYRHFLSHAAFERDFAPSALTVRSVEAALSSAGASEIAVAPGGVTVEAEIAAGAAERLLGVRLVAFDAPFAGPGITAVGTVSLPSSLAGEVVGIDGLSEGSDAGLVTSGLEQLSAPRPVPLGPASYVVGNGSGGADWFFGSDFTQAYDATQLFPGNLSSVPHATYPTRVAIATLLASGYNETNSTVLPPWTPWVVDRYFNDTFPAAWPHPNVTGIAVTEYGAPTPPAPGPFGTQKDSTGFAVENALDLEMAGSLAPGASLYNFYISGALLADPLTAGNAPEYLADDLGAALNYTYGADHLAVVSCSFGVQDLNDSGWDAQLEAAAAMGVTIVASSGDQGNAPNGLTGRDQGQWPLWPATAAFNTSGAISVGGVSVALTGTPTEVYASPPLVPAYDDHVEGIDNVTAWWETLGGPGRYAGSEGGSSLVYAEPYWQFDSAAQPPIVNATKTEGFHQLGRAGPDVAFPANETIAYVGETDSDLPEFDVLGGTSIAAPVFAGLLADIVAVENATRGNVTGLGFLDPELYRIASFYSASPSGLDPFWDVTSGHNAMFSAGRGWDAVTGWGGLSAPLLLAADENASVADYNYSGPTPVLPSGSSPVAEDLTILIVAGAAAAIVVAAAVLLARRTRSGPRAPITASPFSLPPNAPPPVLPPSGLPFATFACPYCGRERPAEPGHCPSCGAM